MRGKIMPLAAGLALVLLAQFSAASEVAVRGVLSVEPLGALLFGPSLQAEAALPGGYSLLLGVRPMQWGILAATMAEEEGYPLRQAVLYAGGLRHYFRRGARLDGWYLGPRIEHGRVVTQRGGTDYATFAMADTGYRGYLASRVCWSAGVQLGAAAGWRGSDGLLYEETRYYPIGQVTATVGYAF